MMFRRSLLQSVFGAAVVTPASPTAFTTDDESSDEESLYRIQLHLADAADEIVVISASSPFDAFSDAADWVTSRGHDLDTPTYATSHGTLSGDTFELLRGKGDIYAPTDGVYRYVDSAEF